MYNMAAELIFVEGGELDHGPGSSISGGTFTVESDPSNKSKLEGNGIYRNTLEYSFQGGSASGVVAGSVRTTVDQEIDPTADFTRADGEKVIRQRDSGTMSAVGDNPSPPPATLPVSGPVTVADPGQSKGKAQ